jgi:hypothetical protein
VSERLNGCRQVAGAPPQHLSMDRVGFLNSIFPPSDESVMQDGVFPD